MLAQLVDQLPAQFRIWIVDADLDQQRHMVEGRRGGDCAVRRILAAFTKECMPRCPRDMGTGIMQQGQQLLDTARIPAIAAVVDNVDTVPAYAGMGMV